MRKIQTAILAWLLLSALFYSCSKREADVLQVASPLPSGIVRSDTAIIVKFSHAVAKPESTLVYTSTPFIEFTPPVQGKFIWQDSSTLVFSPDKPFAGDTKFQGKLNTALLSQYAGGKKFQGENEFTFSTESFYLRSAEFFYDRLSDRRTVGVKANLEFSYAANPADVAKYIKLTIDQEQRQGATPMSTQNSRVIPLEIGAVPQAENEKIIKVEFEPQLTSTETNTHIKMEQPFVFKLPGIGDLKFYGHESGYDGAQGWITIRTSQEVDSASVRSFVVIDPARPYTIEGDRQSFTLRGKFESETQFHLLIKKGLESVLGAQSKNDYEADIVIGNVKPSFGFTSASGTYMLLGGQRKIEFKTVNLPKLAVRVSQIFQNNLTFFLESGRYYDYGWDYYGEEGDEGGMYHAKYRYNVGNYGRQVYYDSITINNVTNQEVTTPFDLSPYIKTDYRGFYVVEIANPTERWRSTAKLVSISDLGLIVKQSTNEVMAFVTNLSTTKPVADATVNLVSSSNQIIASRKSDRDGAVRFENFRDVKKDFYLKLITAESENDFNFINLEDYRVETSRFDVSGKRESENLYDALVYGDRTIYRPGEKIIMSAVVRSLSNPVPSGIPVRLKIYNPRGTMVKEQQHMLNEQGSFETSYPTDPTSLTGTYRFDLYTGNNIYLTSYSVSVEDFVPDRLRVKLTPSAERAKPGETIRYDLQATNFFGPPAANRNYEFEGPFVIVPYISKSFPTFRFSDEAATNYSGNPYVVTGKTDAQGRAVIQFPLPKTLTSRGLLKVRGRVAVFDESGRPVYQLAQTTVYPKDYFIGIRTLGEYYVSPNAPQKMQLIAVDGNDKPVEGFKAKIDLVRYEWNSVLRQFPRDNTLRWVSEKREIPVRSDVVTLGSQPQEYTYSVPRSGEYALRVSKVGDTGYNQFSFYSYSWGTADITSFQVDPEARVQMVFNDSVYAPGDKAKVLFQTPFSGTMLVTVERNRVYSYRYIDVVNNSASVEIPVEESFLPNVYVSAVLFRDIKQQQMPLLVGHGFAPLMVEKRSNLLNVSISAPEKIRPKTKQTATVKAGGEGNAFVTLAAVDEGILQLKNYLTPDPYKYFYAKKGLQTETFDFFKYLLPEPPRSSPGGGEAELAKRVNPLGVQRFKPVSIWSGILKTNGNGEASISLDVPEFNGELRLMALAYRGDRFGSAQKPMKVADPIVITPALPRFLSPNDSISMPIAAFNTTNKPAKLKFEIETSGGVIAISKTATLDVGANEERFVTVPLRSTAQIGKAVVKVRTEAFGETIESTIELPVRPISPYTTESISNFIEGGSSVTLNVEDVFLPYRRQSYITLSPFPVANFAKELKYLVGYPHGCLEQTVSKAFPQIYLRDIATLLDPSILNNGSPTYFVNEAITKVVSMQLPDGSFAYWPGGTVANEWTTVYATHFLLEARKAGYAVPEATVKSALNAITQIARSKRTEDYYSYSNNKVTVRRIADKSSVYALYVLAIGGAPEKTLMNFYRTERSLLTTDTRYLLAGAFALSGDRRTYLELLPQQFVTEDAARQSGGDFDSPIRSNAIILNVLTETDLDNPNIAHYMDYLSKAYKNYRWYSTQDDAFTLLAFGKAARMASATKMSGTIRIGAKEFAYNGGNQKFDIEPFGKNIVIAMKGEGRVYYSLVTSGIRTDGRVKIEDKNLQVRREFLNREGQPVDLNSIKQNDLIIVKLTTISSVSPLDYVAITDLLPAGFEIENPRVTETTNYAFIKNPSTPEYMDIRDDRINIYTNFTGTKQRTFYYIVRAITTGNFQYAPAEAEAMYNGDYYSASGGGKLKVGK